MSTTVTEIFVWIVDEPSGTHKVAAFATGDGMIMPMFSTDRRIADMMRPQAKYVADLCGFPVELHRFELADGPALDRVVPERQGGIA